MKYGLMLLGIGAVIGFSGGVMLATRSSKVRQAANEMQEKLTEKMQEMKEMHQDAQDDMQDMAN